MSKTKDERLVPFVVRLLPSQVEFLRDLGNGAEFIRQAVTEKMERWMPRALAKQRQEMFGGTEQKDISRITRDNLLQLFGEIGKNDPFRAPLVGTPQTVLISLPDAVWSDEALKAKIEAGWSLEELLSFLHAQVHPQFVEAFHSHSEGDQSPMKDEMGATTRREAGKTPDKKPDENSTGGN